MRIFAKRLLQFSILGILLGLITIGITTVQPTEQEAAAPSTKTVDVKTVAQSIVADGRIDTTNRATMHFQMGGKLTYLPFKVGDPVKKGQVIASVDSYALQEQLKLALNNYKAARAQFDTAQENTQVGIAQGQQRFFIDNQTEHSVGGDTQYTAVQDIVKRLADQSQASLDNSVIQVQLANYAMQFSTITAPFDGILTQQDLAAVGTIASPQNSFTVVDTDNSVFKAAVRESDIDLLKVGNPAQVILNNTSDQMHGQVTKIYPEKVSIPNGERDYIVDIQLDAPSDNVAIDRIGVAYISNNFDKPVLLVPAWTVINHNQVWVEKEGKPQLQKVSVGQTHDQYTEVTAGLNQTDKIIVNPKDIIQSKYQLL